MKSLSTKTAICLGAACVLAALSSCNSSSSVSGMLGSINGSITTDSNNDVWGTLSASLITNDYGLAAVNIPVVDPNNASLEYGTIDITPTACASTTCVNSSTVTLNLNFTTVLNATPTSTALPNGTAFPISFSSSSTQLVAVPLGSGGAKVYAAIGGGTYFIGAAVPFAGLDGAGSYTPGADIFANVSINNVTGYIGVFAGSGNNQTGIGVFADLSNLVSGSTATTTATEPNAVHAMAAAAPKTQKTELIPSRTSESEQNNFLYHLWKLGNEKHPTLRYE